VTFESVLVTGGSGFNRRALHLAALEHGLSRADDGALAGARSRRARHAQGRRRGAGKCASPSPPPTSSPTRAGRKQLPGAHIRASRGLALSRGRAQARGTNSSVRRATGRCACCVRRATRASSAWCSPSSFAAVGMVMRPWIDGFPKLTGPIQTAASAAYVKSKTLAERAAWEFIARDGGALELAVVNPVVVFGPVLGPDFSTSVQLLRLLMNGRMPRCPRLSFGIVDVRDVADLHLRAMIDPKAKGERFLRPPARA